MQNVIYQTAKGKLHYIWQVIEWYLFYLKRQVKGGHDCIVDMLLQPENQCTVNTRELEKGESPLHIAALVFKSILIC